MADDISVRIGLEGLSAFKSAADSFVSTIQHMNNAVLRAGTGGGGAGFVGLTAAFAAGSIAAGAFFAVVRGGIEILQDLARVGLDMTVGLNSQLEKSRVAFEGLTGSARVSNAVMAELAELARKRPFELPDIVKGAQQLIGYGVAVERVIPLLNAMGSIAIATGQSTTQAFSSISRAIGQIEAAGKLRGEELRQLYNAGVPLNALFKAMSEQSGKTIAQLQDLQREGGITAEVFRAAFLQLASSNFGDLVGTAAKTLEGSLTIIKNNIAQFAATAFAPFYNRIRDVANAIAEFVSSDAFYEWANRIAGAIEAVLQGLGGLAQGFLAAMQAIVRIVVSAAVVIAKALSYLNPFARHSPSLVEEVEKGLAQIEKSYAALGRAVPQSVKAAQDAMKAFQDSIQDAMNTIESEANRVIMGHLQLLGSAAPAAYEAAQAAIRGLQEQLKQLSAELMAQQRAVDAAANAVDAAQQAVKDQERVIRDAERALRPYREELERAERAVEMQGRAIAAAERALKPYEEAVNAAEDALDKAKDAFKESTDAVSELQKELDATEAALKSFGSVPLQGEEEFDDAIFENELSLKKLQRALNDLEDTGGSAEAIEKLKNEIKELERTGKNLRLDRDIKFDPLRRELEDTIDTSKELTFEEAKAGALAARARIDELTQQLIPAREKAALHAEAVAMQERALASAQIALEKQKDAIIPLREEMERMKMVVDAARDALQEQEKAIQPLRDRLEELRDALSEAQDAYTAEQKKLSQLQKAYNDTAAAIKAMEDALKKAADEAERLAKERDAAAKGGGGGGGADVGDVGGGLDLPDPFDFESIEDKFSKFSDAFKEGFDQMKREMKPFQDSLDKIGKDLEGFATTLDGWAASLDKISGKDVIGFIKDLQEKASDALGPVGTFVDQIRELGSAIGRLSSREMKGDDWLGFIGAIAKFNVASIFIPAALAINIFTTQLEILEKVLDGDWSGAFDALKEGIRDTFEIIFGKGSIDSVNKWSEETQGSITKWADETLKGISTWAVDAWTAIDKWNIDSSASFDSFLTDSKNNTDKWITDTVAGFQKWAADSLLSIMGWRRDSFIEFVGWAVETKDKINKWSAETLLEIISWKDKTGGTVKDWRIETNDDIINWASETGTTILTWQTDTSKTILDWSSNTGATILKWQQDNIKTVGKFALETHNRIINWAGETWDTIIEWAGNTWATIQEWDKNLSFTIGAFIITSIANITIWLQTLWIMISTKFNEIKDNVIETLENLVAGMQEKWDAMVEAAKLAGEAVRDGFWNMVKVLEGWVRGLIDDLVGHLGRLLEGIASAKAALGGGGGGGTPAPAPDGGGGAFSTTNSAATNFSVPGSVMGAETGTVQNNSTVNYNFNVDASYANMQSAADVKTDMEALVMMARK